MSNDAFGDRERAEEAKFKQDQELEFKAAARRNRLLGEWLARQFGMISSEVEAYARDIVMVDFDEPGIEDVIRKVMTDIEKRNADISEANVRAKISEFDKVAHQQLSAEYPGPLDSDHRQIGD